MCSVSERLFISLTSLVSTVIKNKSVQARQRVNIFPGDTRMRRNGAEKKYGRPLVIAQGEARKTEKKNID